MPNIEKPYYYAFADLEGFDLGTHPDWPQHITLTPPTTELSDAPFDSVVDEMAKRVATLGRISVNTGSFEYFGPKHNIGVYRISDPDSQLRHLHHILMSCFDGTVYEQAVDRSFADERYAPHTTPVPGQQERTGLFHIDSVIMGRATELGKEMYRRLPLYPGAIF